MCSCAHTNQSTVLHACSCISVYYIYLNHTENICVCLCVPIWTSPSPFCSSQFFFLSLFMLIFFIFNYFSYVNVTFFAVGYIFGRANIMFAIVSAEHSTIFFHLSNRTSSIGFKTDDALMGRYFWVQRFASFVYYWFVPNFAVQYTFCYLILVQPPQNRKNERKKKPETKNKWLFCCRTMFNVRYKCIRVRLKAQTHIN